MRACATPSGSMSVSRQLAEYTRTMHDQRFTHNDLKWRNLLIDDQQTLYLIDCPNGDFWRGVLAQVPHHQGLGLPRQGG